MFEYLAEILIFTLVISRKNVIGSFSDSYETVHEYNNKRCEKQIDWEIVKYESIGVPPNNDNLVGISALEDSCVTISANFYSDTILKLLVYMFVTSDESGIQVELFENAYEVPILTNFYGKRNAGVFNGWTEIEVPVSVNAVGYIRILGYLNENEIVIVDSLKYTSTKVIHKELAYKNNIVDLLDAEFDLVEYIKIEEKSLIIVNINISDESESTEKELTPIIPAEIEQIDSFSTESEITESSTSESVSTERVPTDSFPTENKPSEINPIEVQTTTSTTEPEDSPNGDSFWNTTTITVVAVASAFVLIVVVTLSVVGAYHLGKIRGTPIIIDDVETPPVRQIPRITNVYGTRTPYSINID